MEKALSCFSIRLTFNNQVQTRKQGGGAINQTWSVPVGEKITQVITWSGWVCDAAQFVTNEGSKSPKFGGGGGSKKVWNAPRGQAMTGIFGGCGGLVDSLGINFDKTSMLRGPPEPMLKPVRSVAPHSTQPSQQVRSHALRPCQCRGWGGGISGVWVLQEPLAGCASFAGWFGRAKAAVTAVNASRIFRATRKTNT